MDASFFLHLTQVLNSIDRAVSEVGGRISSRALFKDLVQNAFQRIDKPLEGHKNVVNTTNIWHLRMQFLDYVLKQEGKVVAAAAEKAIKQSITCYAATLHFNKGQKITKPEYLGHKGHAPIFESIRRYEGKCAAVARLPDLLGKSNPKTPWKDRLARLVFVSDMGDALSSKGDFEFLKKDLMSEPRCGPISGRTIPQGSRLATATPVTALPLAISAWGQF